MCYPRLKHCKSRAIRTSGLKLNLLIAQNLTQVVSCYTHEWIETMHYPAYPTLPMSRAIRTSGLKLQEINYPAEPLRLVLYARVD